MNSTILAIDLGKFNSVFCWYDPDARAPAFRTAATTPGDLRRELARPPVARVVFEACSQAGWAHDLCDDLRLPAGLEPAVRVDPQPFPADVVLGGEQQDPDGRGVGDLRGVHVVDAGSERAGHTGAELFCYRCS